VGRTAALTLAFACTVASCGQARFAAPPPPEFSNGQRAEPTIVDTSVVDGVKAGGGGDGAGERGEILLSAIEADADGVDLDQMVLVDDAGTISPNSEGWGRFDDSLERRLIPADVGASVAVMVDGQVVHQAAFGERIAGSGEAVDPNDRFRIASISKTITAITVLRLVEAGTLTLDDPVGSALVEHLGVAPYDPDAVDITVRGLLSHTAGLAQHDGVFFSNGAASCAEAAAIGLSRSVSSGPGFRYSNMNYCVLGVLIEAVTGKTYERVVDEELLTPLGLTGMRLTSTYELGPDEVSHHPSPNRNFMETLGAAGAWNATPTDLVTILNSIDASTPGWKALSDDTIDVLRYRVPTGAPATGYGLGLINYAGDAYGHTGTIQNTHAMVLVHPDGLTWAITASGEYPSNTGRLRSIMATALAAGFPTS
jgi:D-alanyl-D-alanine carboxypeptidase